MEAIKIAVVGSTGAGKTAIIAQFMSKTFLDGDYTPTIEESHFVRREFGCKFYDLQIMDTAGSDEYTSLREVAITNGQGFIVVYTVTCGDSFATAKRFIQTIYEIKAQKPLPIILVGNKADLEKERAVETTEGEAAAKEFDTLFMEITAKDEKLVEKLFCDLLQKIEQVHGKKGQAVPSVSKKSCCVVL